MSGGTKLETKKMKLRTEIRSIRVWRRKKKKGKKRKKKRMNKKNEKDGDK